MEQHAAPLKNPSERTALDINLLREKISHDIAPHYHFLKFCGQGVTGMVFKAVHLHTNKQVAMKYISNVFDNVGVARRYLREVQTMVQMSQMHNLVTLYDVLLVPDRTGSLDSLYLVMSSMSFDLAYMLASDKVKLDQDSVKFIVYQLLNGICNLHAAGIIHRDIKPANILLNSECSLKICDYGLARDLNQMQNPYKAFKTFKQTHAGTDDSWVAF